MKRTKEWSRLPEKPETLADLKARYKDSLFPVVDVAQAKADIASAYYPGKFRRHVFDTLEGLRMIISRDKYPDGVIALHVSFSPTERLAKTLRDKDTVNALEELLLMASRFLRDLSGIDRRPDVVEMYGKAIHWLYEGE